MRKFLFYSLILLLSAISFPYGVSAQGTVTWSEPVNLSNTPTSSTHPAIVTDAYGYVHVFWSEDVDGEPLQPDEYVKGGDTIMYTRWDGNSWTLPIDLFLIPGEPTSEYVAAHVDAQQRIRLVWTGQWNIYYASAPADKAISAQAWTSPVIIARDSARSRLESSVTTDAAGTIHVFYAARGESPGIYHTQSQDNGDTWGLAVRISEPLDVIETNLMDVKAVSDASGQIHVVWATSNSEGFGQAVYYTRSTDLGNTWEQPKQLGYKTDEDYGASWPMLAQRDNSELILVYENTPRALGRKQRISLDGGATWSEPNIILPEMIGLNGYITPIVDSTNQRHLIINMRPIATQRTGIYYAYGLGTGWSSIIPVVVEHYAAPDAHFTTAALRSGNEIHVVWNPNYVTADPNAGGEIWHIQGIINSAPAQTPLPIPPAQQQQQAAPATRQPTVIAQLAPTSTPALAVDNNFPIGSTQSSFLTAPLVLSTVATLLVVLGAVAWQRMSRR